MVWFITAWQTCDRSMVFFCLQTCPFGSYHVWYTFYFGGCSSTSPKSQNAFCMATWGKGLLKMATDIHFPVSKRSGFGLLDSRDAFLNYSKTLKEGAGSFWRGTWKEERCAVVGGGEKARWKERLRLRPHVSGNFFLPFSPPFIRCLLILFMWTDKNSGFRVQWCHTL